MSERGVAARQKEVLANQAGQCCEYCRAPARYSVSSFSVEHIVPRARGGTATPDNLAYVIGITATGRATVDALRLNREELLNLRRVLFMNGEHPPMEEGKTQQS